MLFNEVYGSYYNAVAHILRESVEGTLTGRRLHELVQKLAFSESSAVIPDALRSQRWPLLDGELKTPLKEAPTMPLTTLQKRWLKALLLDPRIALFDPPSEGLEDVEPLYTPDMFVFFDRYADGDPFDDPAYIQNFRAVLTALREKRRVRVSFRDHRGMPHAWTCLPCRLEYSEKDDKFRLITASNHFPLTINMARIQSVELLEPCAPGELQPPPRRQEKLVLELTDQRNALERVMLHFSHLEKETERLSEDRYRMTVTYDREDETELLIRVLSFGPVVKVVEPQHFIDLLRERLHKQKNCGF